MFSNKSYKLYHFIICWLWLCLSGISFNGCFIKRSIVAQKQWIFFFFCLLCLHLSQLLGWYSIEFELHPSGHQTIQLGRPAWGLQPVPGKSNTGPPFPPGLLFVCVCVSVCLQHMFWSSQIRVCLQAEDMLYLYIAARCTGVDFSVVNFATISFKEKLNHIES